MILHTLRTDDVELEKALLHWFEENFGQADADALAAWLWARERNPVLYLDALTHIATTYKRIETAENLGNLQSLAPALKVPPGEVPTAKQWLGNLLAQARKPKERREAEEELLAFVMPLQEKLVAKVRAASEVDREKAADEAMEEFRARVREWVRRAWPDRHRATVDGALMVAARKVGGKLVFDVSRVVAALFAPDALAATAASSHG